jgi:hypothetical protein
MAASSDTLYQPDLKTISMTILKRVIFVSIRAYIHEIKTRQRTIQEEYTVAVQTYHVIVARERRVGETTVYQTAYVIKIEQSKCRSTLL